MVSGSPPSLKSFGAAKIIAMAMVFGGPSAIVNHMNNCSHAVSIKSVVKRYDSLTALNDVTLDISRGEFFWLLGPNGAGKSTTMSLISGLRAPDSGTVLLEGRPASDPQARRKLGLVPQGLALYPDLTAAENLRIFGGLNGLKGSEVGGAHG
ncbi:MAG TPA: ATP-binding cassette domain-containing protein [Verrucomicrobiae bacterium]